MNDPHPEAAQRQHLPFATGADRLKLLYRLPIAQAKAHILVIGTRQQAQDAYALDAPHVRVWDPSAHPRTPCPADASFDAVALPGSLRPMRAREGGHDDPAPRDLLALALAALKPGGQILGHIDPSLSVSSVARVARQPALLAAWMRSLPWGTALRCAQQLSQAGFIGVECFHVEPRISAPTALIASQPAASRRHFVRSTRRNRPLYSGPGYLLRLLIAQLGMGGLLQAQVYFLARKPC